MEINERQMKFQAVYDYLLRGIESGFYQPDRRLPSERALAEKLEVNVSTIRRAFRDLITGGIVEKRIGDGTYLCEQQITKDQKKYVNILLSSYDGAAQDEIAEIALAEGARRNIRCRVIRLHGEEILPFVRTAICFRQPTMVLGDGILSEAAIREIAKAPYLFAVLANRLDHLGVPSVIGDDHHGIRILVEHLRGLGHQRIALLHNNSGHPIENIQIAVWRSLTGGNAPELRADVPRGMHPVEYAFRVVDRNAPYKGEFTALICLNEELAQGALAAFSEAGIKVPKQVSVTVVGDTIFCRYSVPPLTALNPNLAEHVSQGFELLAHNRLRVSGPDKLRMVEPQLTVRKSTAPNRFAQK